ncbi:MAG: hypothetical protein MJZ36_11450 [Bacteroidaceae bacterium]|nr:hypothetical protein [Bacteroidaceae bacterium]
MKHLSTSFIILTLAAFVLFPQSCTTNHSEREAYIKEVEANIEDFDHLPSDSLALQVATYMEMNGTPEERMQAWRNVGKVYDRMNNAGYKAEAYRMAVNSIDTTRVFDTLLFATTLTEYAQVLAQTLHPEQARHETFRAIRMAEEMGDTVHAMYFRCTNYNMFHSDTTSGFDVARKAYHYLWTHDERQLAVDGYGAALFLSVMAYSPDSCLTLLDRFAKYSHHNVIHPQSWWAREYWLTRANAFQRMEEKDSCLHYLRMLAHADLQRFEGSSIRGCSDLAQAFREYGENDSADYYQQMVRDVSFNDQRVKMENEGKVLSHIYNSLHTQMEHEEAVNRLHTFIAFVFVIVFVLVLFLLYRQRMLRRRHQELLQQNAEYVSLLHSMQTKDAILESNIVKHFHELSSHDSHPSAEEWQELYRLVDEQHPNLFPSLSKDYTLTEQEKHVVCLIVAKCTPSQMAILLVYSKPNVSNLRRRLFCKLTGNDGSGVDLDELVNSYC